MGLGLDALVEPRLVATEVTVRACAEEGRVRTRQEAGRSVVRGDVLQRHEDRVHLWPVFGRDGVAVNYLRSK